MHRILVEEKRWIGETRFLHALNYCMLLPGPEAQQLAIYIGWLLHGIRGGLVAGIFFIIPGIVALLGLSWLYATYGHIPAVEALFVGLKAAVLAVVIEALLRISRRALRDPAMVWVAGGAFIAIFAFAVPFPAIIAAAALTGVALSRIRDAKEEERGAIENTVIDRMMLDPPEHVRPSRKRTVALAAIFLSLWLAPTVFLVQTSSPRVFADVALFFTKTAVVTFGGAYAVLAYVAQQAVEHFAWLKPGEMLDGLGMAETTPGPLIMVLQFVGFMAAYRDNGALSPATAGVLGGLLTTWVTFTPCFLWIFAGAPYIEALRRNRILRAALSVVTAAVVGVILNLAVWFALHVMFAAVHQLRAGFFDIAVPMLASARWLPIALSAVAVIALFVARIGMIGTFAVTTALGLVAFAFGVGG
jgi:chromate transporter